MKIKKLLFVTKFEDLCYTSFDFLLSAGRERHKGRHGNGGIFRGQYSSPPRGAGVPHPRTSPISRPVQGADPVAPPPHPGGGRRFSDHRGTIECRIASTRCPSSCSLLVQIPGTVDAEGRVQRKIQPASQLLLHVASGRSSPRPNRSN